MIDQSRSLPSCDGAALIREALASDLHGGSSLVLLDAGSSDVISSAVGLKALIDLGVVNAGCLTESPDRLATTIAATAATIPSQRLSSITVFLSTLLDTAQDSLVMVCKAAAPFTSKIVVACSLSEQAHHDEAPQQYPPVAVYNSFVSLLQHRLLTEAAAQRQQMPQLDIIIKYVPLHCIPLSVKGFVLAAGSAAGQAMAAGHPLGLSIAVPEVFLEDQDPATVPFNSLESRGISTLAHTLASIAQQLNLQPEAFCLGPAARAVGRALSFVPGQEGATPAAFVLVDRGIDIVTPLQHSDLLLSRVWEVLSEEDDNNDNSSVQALVPSLDSFPLVAGSLLHPHDEQATANLAFLLSRPGKDAALFLRKWLREACRKEGAAPLTQRFKPGNVSSAEINALSASLRAKIGNKMPSTSTSSLLQLAAAAALALDDTKAAHWDALSREERALIMACAEGNEPVTDQLVDLIGAAARGNKDGGGAVVRLSDAMSLMAMAYQLLPDTLPWYAKSDNSKCNAFTDGQEDRLRNAVADAVLSLAISNNDDGEIHLMKDQVPWLPEALWEKVLRLIEDRVDASMQRALYIEVKDAVEGRLLSRLREFSVVRQQHKITKSNEQSAPPTSLLVQIADNIVERKEMESLELASTSLAGLLKSGLGRIGLQSQKPHPGDYSVVVIFVIGGVSLIEMHEVVGRVERLGVERQARAQSDAGDGGRQKPPPTMIVGGSMLIHPKNMQLRLFR